jgi:hypothetical protein
MSALNRLHRHPRKLQVSLIALGGAAGVHQAQGPSVASAISLEGRSRRFAARLPVIRPERTQRRDSENLLRVELLELIDLLEPQTLGQPPGAVVGGLRHD